LTFLGLLPANEEQKLITGHQLYRELASLSGLTPESSLVAKEEAKKVHDSKEAEQDEEFWSVVALGARHYCDKNRCYTDLEKQGEKSKPTPAS
jgi:hypothetical protein